MHVGASISKLQHSENLKFNWVIILSDQVTNWSLSFPHKYVVSQINPHSICYVHLEHTFLVI